MGKQNVPRKIVNTFLIHLRNNQALLELTMKRVVLILSEVIKGLSSHQFARLQQQVQDRHMCVGGVWGRG